MNSETDTRSVPMSNFYDIWKEEEWIGMAMGDTPSIARQYIMESFPGWPGDSGKFLLMPFYGLNTSQNTFRSLGTLKPQEVSGGNASVDPINHGIKQYDVWHNRHWIGTIEASTPSEAREKSDKQWPSRDCHEILLAPNYGAGTEYATFEALRGCRAKQQHTPQAMAS